ncbi:MAG: nucleoside deaminase [Candidatus Dojkabacteria bacterium]
MLEAIAEARVGLKKKEGGPFGAVIVKKNRIVSKAHNTVLKSKDSTCHAEMDAIRKACKALGSHDLSGCEIYTTGKPCPMCKSAIQWAKISKVYYGCTYADAKKIGFDELSGNSKKYVEIQMVKTFCQELYDEFTNTKGKTY